MAGRKPILINLKATSPDGEVRFFRSIKDAARELGFSKHGVGRAYHDGRNRISQYELEWLKPEPVEEPPKIKPRRKPRNTTGEIKKKVEEKMNKAKEENLSGRMVLKCTFCGKELDGKDISNYLIMEELDSSGNSIDLKTYKSLYEASQNTVISLNAFRNARDKGNTVIEEEIKPPLGYRGQAFIQNALKLRRKLKDLRKEKEREIGRS